MLPVLTSILTGLTTKAIPTLLSSSGVKRAVLGSRNDLDALEAQVSSDVTARLAYESISQRLVNASITKEATTEFLASEEMDALLRQLLSAFSAGRDVKVQLVERTANLISLYFPSVTGQAKEALANDFAVALQETVDITVTSLLSRNIIPSDAWVTAETKQLIADELIALLSDLTRPLDLKPSDMRSLRKFSVEYLGHIGRHCQYLIPPNISEVKEIPIESLYVAGTFVPESSGKQKAGTISRQELLDGAYRVVILGNPGGGKSTFAKKLCFDLWAKRANYPVGGRQLIPFLVVLKDFARKRTQTSLSILEFLNEACRSDFQMETVPEGAIARLLRTGHALVIFDGLDELLNTVDRLEIKQTVEHFCHEYASVPVLITSRQVGYEQAPLDTRVFKIFILGNFTDEQVSEYAQKWFTLNKLENGEEQKKLYESFLEESKIVADIRSNPLMLALMCNLYRQDGYIPRNRPDVYARCADLLFVKWDKSRGIKHGLGLEHQIRPAMNHLAHWIYSNDKLQEGVTEEALVQQLTGYLESQFDTVEEAEGRARALIEFCRDRAWVFSDTGSTESARLYQFTHRTFLEFFTAEHLIRKYRSPDDLFEQLAPRIGKREWDMVAQLSFQLKANQFEGATDELLAKLLDVCRIEESGQSQNYLVFLTKTLEFMCPAPSLRRKVVTSFLDEAENTAKNEIGEKGKVRPADKLYEEGMQNLLSVSEDNWPTVSSAFENWFIEGINEGPSDSAIARSLMLELTRFSAQSGRPQHRANLMIPRIIEATRLRRESLASQSQDLAIMNFWHDSHGSTYRQLISEHGIKALFHPIEHIMCNVTTWPVVNSRFHFLCGQPSDLSPSLSERCASSSELAKILYENFDKLHGIAESRSARDWGGSDIQDPNLRLPQDANDRFVFAILAFATILSGSKVSVGPISFRRLLKVFQDAQVPDDIAELVRSLKLDDTVSAEIESFLRELERRKIASLPEL